eukprot:Phypoly_transcript_09634.p1 GENE.Phypoly_transcript_09634~~Phypoly_transcript_09634.p1  ORF type:complete len:409 (+),score=78.04 Phypoly_transcript_09634:128-1354(+)
MSADDYDEADNYLSLCDVPIFTDQDMALAMRLQQEEDAINSRQTTRETDTEFSDLSIQELFVQFDKMYFKASLASVFVEWSKRMTLCAGVCVYQGKGGMCAIRLSEPLLKFRPRDDMVNTLLHEMIHAYLFVTADNRDHDAHGEQFQKLMKDINARAGTRITIYHNFTDEVDFYRTHWWQCDGPCKNRASQGIVKRAMNRPPGPTDYWWNAHQQNCGGTFTKIKEPEEYSKKKRKLEEKKEKKQANTKKSPTLDKFFTKTKTEKELTGIKKENTDTPKQEKSEKNNKQQIIIIEDEEDEDEKASKKIKREYPFLTNAPTSTTTKTNTTNPTSTTNNNNKPDQKPINKKNISNKDNANNKTDNNKTYTDNNDNHNTTTNNKAELMVPCPACTLTFHISEINNHLDVCLL